MKNILTALALIFSISVFGQVPAGQDSTNKPAPKDTTMTIQKGELKIEDGKIKGDVYTQKADSNYVDTTRIELKNAYITIVSKESDDEDDWEDDKKESKYSLTWWNGLDLGVNGILSENHDFNLQEDAEFLEPKYGKSRYISFNFAQAKVNIANNYFGITTGLSFQIYNWKYSGANDFVFSGDSLFSVPSGEKNVTKNKLRASYLAVPLMLEFNTSLDQDRAFHISAGVIGKVLIGNMYKQKYELEGNDRKATLKGEMGFTRWSADALVRVGYRRLTLFAQVGLVPLFDNANTSDVYTFSTGFFIKV